MEDYRDAKPMMKVLDEDIPSVSFLDGVTNPIIEEIHLTSELLAYALNLLWDNLGAWEANENVKNGMFQAAISGRNTWQPHEEGGQDMLVININEIESRGKQKASLLWLNATGQQEQNKKPALKTKAQKSHCAFSKKLSLDDFMCCSRCKVAIYCTHKCQKDHWKVHKLYC